ncbi:MAG: hypothetical protein ACK4N5_10800 [Myxococcales bacterium]
MRHSIRVAPVLGLAAVLSAFMVIVACGEDTAFTIEVPTEATRADGKTAANIVVRVLRGTNPVEGEVTISTSLGSFSAIDDPTQVPDGTDVQGSLSSGEFKAKLFSAQPGNAKVTVKFVEQSLDGTQLPPVTKSANVEFGSGGAGSIAVLEFVGAEPETIALSGSGGKATSTITFRAKDSSGGAVAPGIPVKFELAAPLGGARLDPAESKTEPGGTVKTVLFAGTAVGTVRVRAIAGGVTEESTPITIAGRSANFRNFSVICDERSIGAAFDQTMSCTALVADRNTQKLTGVQVTFMTEAGSITPVATTDSLGNAVAEYKTQEPYPADVTPANATDYAKFETNPRLPPEQREVVPPWLKNPEDNGSEPSWQCNPGKVCNPRDGLVTLIAVTAGEEEWSDTNQNGVWDDGEAFVDLPEPFVDINDNTKYDANDPVERDLYIDANKNGQWDDKNGQWDGTTLIWKSYKFVWTYGLNGTHTGFYTNTASPTKISNINVPHCGAASYKILVVDQNLNFLANRDGDTIGVNCGDSKCDVKAPTELLIHRIGHGRKYIGFTSGDTHSCEPDCKGELPPCGPMTDSALISGTFTQSREGAVLVPQNAKMSVAIQ